jgi:hypothetical protein
VVPGGPADTPLVPRDSGFDRGKLIAPDCMAPPMLWLCSEEADCVTGQRYVAAEWDCSVAPGTAAKVSNPAAWPSLAWNVVWPDDTRSI